MRHIFWLMGLLFLGSCITQKDLVYFQETAHQSTKPVEVSQNAIVSYRLQPHDLLSIKIKTIDNKINALFETHLVEPSANIGALQFTEQGLFFNGYSLDDLGNINIPLIGKLNVLGFTTAEVSKAIETKLLDEYLSPNANLFVLVKMAGIRYVINGEINKPGINFIYNNKATIMDAIANSGDITLVGDRKAVMIYRQTPNGVNTYTLNLTDKSAMFLPEFYLQPNDLIYIKPLKQKTWGFGTNNLQTFTTVLSVVTLITTTYLLLRND